MKKFLPSLSRITLYSLKHHFRWFSSLIIILLSVTTLIAQERIVSGKVYDQAEKITLPGVNVVLKGTSQGTVTDFDGNYSITVTGDTSVLVFNYIGYKDLEYRVGNKAAINVFMEADVVGLDEVVVIGYGTQKKMLVTGAISKVEAENIERIAPVRAEQALLGQTPGVTVFKSSGSPGAPLNIRVRGTSSNSVSEPLYVVDGVRTSSIDYLDPNDIESIEVLKDAASAAIYGAEGGNGVVMVTTKKGKAGKGMINYDFYYGLQDAPGLGTQMNAQQYSTYMREGIAWETEWAIRKQGFDDEVLIDFLVNNAIQNSGIPDPDTLGTGTDWLGEISGQAPIMRHYISFLGGNEKADFAASFSYLDQDGVIGGDKSNFKRYTARVNAKVEVLKWADIGANIYYAHTDRNTLPENNEYGGLITNAMYLDPTTPNYYATVEDIPSDILLRMTDSDNFGSLEALEASTAMQDGNGYFGVSTLVNNEMRNPLAQIHNSHNLTVTDRINGNAFLNLKFLDNRLNLRTMFGIDMTYSTFKTWSPVMFWHKQSFDGISQVSKSIGRTFPWQWENFISWEDRVGDGHSYSVLAGMTVLERNQSYLRGNGQFMQQESDNFAHIDATLSDTVFDASGSALSEERLLSYFARATYNYKERYLIHLTFRADGSSKFAPNNKWGYFPSASVGWVTSNESFWGLEWFTYLKVRGSWGRNGNLSSLTNFMYVSTVSNVVYATGSTQVGPLFMLDASGNIVNGAEPVALSNPDLVWETVEQLDIGVDMQFLNGKIFSYFDWYDKRTVDLLARGGVPEYVGNQSPWTNAGEIQNTGVEMAVGYRDRFGKFGMNLSLNATYNKNEVLSYDFPTETANYNGTPINRFESGFPAYYIWGLKTDGVFQTIEDVENYTNADGELIQPFAVPGDLRFQDLNEDGIISADDKTYLGSPWPEWILGFNFYFDFYGFDLSGLLIASIGNEVFNGLARVDMPTSNLPEYFYTDRWTPGSGNNDMFKATFNNTDNFQASDFFVEDASYLRMNNLQLGYTLPQKVYDKTAIRRLRFYVSALNLFTVTNYRGSDPAVGNTVPAGEYSYGIDRGMYPYSRTIMFGLNLGF